MSGGDAGGDLERQFNPRAAVPDHARFLEGRGALSERVARRLGGGTEIRFGPGPKETADIFAPPGASGAPVHIYFHGGYWRANDKSEFAFVAGPIVDAGGVAVIANYDLCPDVTVAEIVAQSRRLVAWVHAHAGAHGGDPARLTVSGSSAGGHLVAMLLAHDWTVDGLPEDAIRGAVAITGVYDCAPVLEISVNEQIRLRPEDVVPLSPVENLPRRALPLVVAVGGGETEGWIAMSRRYADLCKQAGVPATYLELAGENHFTVTGLLEARGNLLTEALIAQMTAA